MYRCTPIQIYTITVQSTCSITWDTTRAGCCSAPAHADEWAACSHVCPRPFLVARQLPPSNLPPLCPRSLSLLVRFLRLRRTATEHLDHRARYVLPPPPSCRFHPTPPLPAPSPPLPAPSPPPHTFAIAASALAPPSVRASTATTFATAATSALATPNSHAASTHGEHRSCHALPRQFHYM